MTGGYRSESPVGRTRFGPEADEYGDANAQIQDVRFDNSNLSTGDRTNIIVDVKNEKSSTSSTSGFDIMFLYVTSPQLDQHLILKCQIIEPGQTLTIDSSSGDTPGLDGDFTVSDPQMEFNVTTGHYTLGTNCVTSNLPSPAGTQTDSATKTLDASGSTTEDPNYQIDSLSSPSSNFEVGDTVEVSATFTNSGGPGTRTVTIGVGPSGDRLERFSQSQLNLDAGETQTRTLNFDIPAGGGEWDTLIARIEGTNKELSQNITVSTPELNDALSIIPEGTGWARADNEYSDGETGTFRVSVENVDNIAWRVEAIFTNPDTGDRLDTQVQERLDPGDVRNFAVEVQMTAPETTVCYEFNGQPKQ